MQSSVLVHASFEGKGKERETTCGRHLTNSWLTPKSFARIDTRKLASCFIIIKPLQQNAKIIYVVTGSTRPSCTLANSFTLQTSFYSSFSLTSLVHMAINENCELHLHSTEEAARYSTVAYRSDLSWQVPARCAW